MRLHKIKLTNYRGVSHADVELSGGVTVVEGPNEVGKSSLAEAIRLIRTHKDSSKARIIRDIQPIGKDVGPGVEVHLSAGSHQMVYRKRWLKSALTELAVTGASTEQLSGDEAHVRFEEIMAQAIDMDLLTAMDVAQGESLEQPGLAQIRSLQQALEEPEMKQEGKPETTDLLMERVSAEYKKYFTPSGRLGSAVTGEAEKLSGVGEQLEQLREQSRQIDELARDHSAAIQELDGFDVDLQQAQEKLTICKQRADELEELRSALRERESELDVAAASLKAAETALRGRRDLAAELSSCEEALVAEKQEFERIAEEHLKVRSAAEELATAQEQGELEVQEKRSLLALQLDDLEVKRASLQLADLTGRLVQAEEAWEKQQSATRLLQGAKIDEDAVARLEAAELELRIAQKTREASAAKVSVRKMGNRAVHLDGMEVGSTDEVSLLVVEPVAVEVDGVLSVKVTPGVPSAELLQREEAAKLNYEDDLERLGVKSVEDARAELKRCEHARGDLDQAAISLAHILAGSTLEQLRRDVSAARDRSAGQTSGAESQEELAASVVAGEKLVAQARSALDQATESLEMARSNAEALREVHQLVRDDYVRYQEMVRNRTVVVDNLRKRLDGHREIEPDAALEEKVMAQSNLVLKQRAAVDSENDRLRALDPDRIEMELKNMLGVVSSTKDRRDSARSNVDRLSALLDYWSGRGIHDQLGDLEAEYETVRVTVDRLTRSAAAAKLLWSVMNEKKEDAQRKYVAPFKEKIEVLGRIVFGPTFTVSISPDLQVESRTLNGLTVPFGSLSAGAKEQVALLGRLAAAQLIESGEGAPLILDDTMGFADAERLAALSMVLGQVGDTAQVIVLTCQPVRFKNLGGAKFVKLVDSPRLPGAMDG